MTSKNEMAVHALVLGSLLVVWFVYVLVSGESLVVASPGSVFSSLASLIVSGGDPTRTPDFYLHLSTTLYEVGVAFLLSVLVATPLGVALGLSRQFREVFEPFLLAFYAFPLAVLYPIVFILFGVQTAAKIAIGFLIGFFYIAFDLSSVLQQVDRDLIDLGRSFGYSRLRILYKIVAPSQASLLIAAFRKSFAFSFVGVLVGEILLSNQGLGFLLNWTGTRFYTPELYALIMLVSLVGVAFDSVFRFIERGMVYWKPT